MLRLNIAMYDIGRKQTSLQAIRELAEGSTGIDDFKKLAAALVAAGYAGVKHQARCQIVSAAGMEPGADTVAEYQADPEARSTRLAEFEPVEYFFVGPDFMYIQLIRRRPGPQLSAVDSGVAVRVAQIHSRDVESGQQAFDSFVGAAGKALEKVLSAGESTELRAIKPAPRVFAEL